jgi:hypothetical protein
MSKYQTGSPSLHILHRNPRINRRWDTEIRMYAGVIRSAVHTAFRRGIAIAAVPTAIQPDKDCLREGRKTRPVTAARFHREQFSAAILLKWKKYTSRARRWSLESDLTRSS